MENNSKTIVYVAIALTIGLGAGYYYASTASYQRGYSLGYEKAREEIKSRLEDTRTIEPTPKDIRIISGTIKSIGENQFTIESRLPFDPTMPGGGQSRSVIKTVFITPSTEIVIEIIEANNATPKSGEQFRPFIVKRSKVDLKSLRVSDAVVVEASENIINKTSFDAISVIKNNE
jgi:hypothetical protein